jgi:glycosyltransferase involved in cell wall biosynthesis
MRICLFTPNFLPAVGGAERAADTIVRGLIARGHEVMVLCQRSGPMPDVPYAVRRYRRPPAQHLWPELLAWPLWRAYRAQPFDVLLAFYGYPTGYAASLLKQRLGYKLIISARGGDMYKSFHGLSKPRVARVIRAAYRRADRVIAVSQWIKSRIVEVCGDASGGNCKTATEATSGLPPIDTVPNGIDLTIHDRLRDQSRSSPPPAVSTVLGDARFVLHLATLNPVKGHALAIEAVGRLRETFAQTGLKYVIAGDGQSMPAIRRQVAELGLDGLVVLLGSRVGVEKAWLLDHARFMVTTSREEGMPNVVLESMAAGLPILASDIGPHRELVQDRGWGTLFKDGNVDDLTAQMGAMITQDLDPQRQAALSLRDYYSLNGMIDGFEQSCLAALNDKST